MSKKDIRIGKNDSVSSAFITQQVYSSPLPPPEILIKYQQLNPHILNKVIEMAEIQSEHRRKLENDYSQAQTKHSESQIKHLERRDKEARLGQIFGFLISILGLSGGIYTALKGYQWAGSFISAMGLTAIVPAFIYGRQAKQP